jgi:hypothetical protein
MPGAIRSPGWACRSDRAAGLDRPGQRRQ